HGRAHPGRGGGPRCPSRGERASRACQRRAEARRAPGGARREAGRDRRALCALVRTPTPRVERPGIEPGKEGADVERLDFAGSKWIDFVRLTAPPENPS